MITIFKYRDLGDVTADEFTGEVALGGALLDRKEAAALAKAIGGLVESTPKCGLVCPDDRTERCLLVRDHRERHQSKNRAWDRDWDQGDEIDAMARAHHWDR